MDVDEYRIRNSRPTPHGKLQRVAEDDPMRHVEDEKIVAFVGKGGSDAEGEYPSA